MILLDCPCFWGQPEWKTKWQEIENAGTQEASLDPIAPPHWTSARILCTWVVFHLSKKAKAFCKGSIESFILTFNNMGLNCHTLSLSGTSYCLVVWGGGFPDFLCVTHGAMLRNSPKGYNESCPELERQHFLCTKERLPGGFSRGWPRLPVQWHCQSL
jgi:hypothetical protein